MWPRRFVLTSSNRQAGLFRVVHDILRHADLFPLPLTTNVSWRGTPILTRRSVRLIHERVFVLGDAAGYVEPFTGEGMAWAIKSARMATPWILESMREWNQTRAVGWDKCVASANPAQSILLSGHGGVAAASDGGWSCTASDRVFPGYRPALGAAHPHLQPLTAGVL